MHPMTLWRARGYGLIELMVAVAILVILLVLGLPAMSDWLQASKAAGASEFYAEGVRTARAEAVRHNAVTRLVLAPNAISGQSDWTVDLCFPTATTPCNNASGVWSSVGSSAKGDPNGDKGFHSVLRSASTLLHTDRMQQAVQPVGASAVYFTAMGWVDTNVPARLTRIDLTPASRPDAFPASAVVITLAGNAVKCDPNATPGDSRACQ